MTVRDPEETRRRFARWLVATALLAGTLGLRFATGPTFARVLGVRVADLLTGAAVVLAIAFLVATWSWLRSAIPVRKRRITVKELRRRAGVRS